MTRKEWNAVCGEKLRVYQGILFNHQNFGGEGCEEVVYEFDCPEFEELRTTYDLDRLAGKGSDFVRAKRLLHYFAPRLHHSSWYDNHVECNALRLLEYSLNNPEQGINCLNKSKILQECCSAVGIYARRVGIYPFSPYDFDNHVVTEIYDRGMEKWIMLDPTTDGYFVDENKTPLSLLEMRHRFANAEFITFVSSRDSLKDLQKLRDKYAYNNSYICKNLFYFMVERYVTFGEKGEYLGFIPEHYSIKEKSIANYMYRIKNLPPEHEQFRKISEERLQKARESEEPKRTDIRMMQAKPN